MLEAIIMMAVLSLVLLLLLPLSGRALARDWARGLSIQQRGDEVLGEMTFRRLLRTVVAPPAGKDEIGVSLIGGPAELNIYVAPHQSIACAQGRALTALKLTIEQHNDRGRLVCANRETSRGVIDWRGRNARFGYSLDGRNWSAASAPVLQGGAAAGTLQSAAALRAPFVALIVDGPNGPRILALERAGGDRRVDAPIAASAAQP